MTKSIDPIWEQIFSSREWGQYPAENVIRFIARNYYKYDRSNVRVLDFGCGGGAHTWYLAREGFDVYAFDGSPSAVEKTRLKLSKDGLKASVQVMDGCDVHYDNNFFDAVIDSVCIYSNTIKNIQLMYKSIFNVLKPGGKLLTVAFSDETSGFGTGDKIENGTYTNITDGSLAERGVTHFWHDGELPFLLAGIGFTNIKQEYEMYSNSGDIVKLFVVVAKKPE